MDFELVKTLDVPSHYGSIPQPDASKGQSETYVFDWDDMQLMVDDFSGPINDLCGTLFDLGDVDYIPAEKCDLLAKWLSHRLTTCDGRLYELYTILLDYVSRAIELGTGVIVDL